MDKELKGEKSCQDKNDIESKKNYKTQKENFENSSLRGNVE